MNKTPDRPVVILPIAELKPYERNSRTHSDEQIKQIVKSLKEFGWTNPVLIDEENGIIAGHARVEAAKRLGMNECPTICLAGLTAKQKKAYIIADNKLAMNAGWDTALLSLEMLDLKDLEFDLSLLGFDELELSELLNPQQGEGLTDPDEVPEAPKTPVTVPGDLWVMGGHRLLCGDCRDFNVIQNLIGETKINIVFTSPPYAEQRKYDESSGFRPIPPDEYIQWYSDLAINIRSVLAEDGSYFLNIKPSCDGPDTSLYVFDLVLAHVRQLGFRFATEFCWERNGVPKSVTQRFKNQFEPIYQFSLGRWKMRPDAVRHESDNVPHAGGPGSGETSWANKEGGKGANSVSGSFGAEKKKRSNLRNKDGSSGGIGGVGQGRPSSDYGEAIIAAGLAYPGNRLPTFASSHSALGHTAAFPVGLPSFFIRAFTDPHDSVFDPFMGSGSTLIASDQNGRIAYGTEISPAYCDVIVERWQKFTGKQAVLEGDDRTFLEIKTQRSGGLLPVLPQENLCSL